MVPLPLKVSYMMLSRTNAGVPCPDNTYAARQAATTQIPTQASHAVCLSLSAVGYHG